MLEVGKVIKAEENNPTCPNQTDRITTKLEVHLINVDIPPAQLNLGLLDLFLQFLMRFWDVVERQDCHT